MSLLNQLFNRGLLGTKCKTCLTLTISRIKLLQNKRDSNVKQMRKEIAQFLQTGQEAIARIRVEHVFREQNVWAAYEILELFCEFVLARVPVLESQRDCPPELREAIASIMFAAPRCSDLPDLSHIKNLFSAKYGKEFVLAASELRPDTSVNRALIETLSISAPSGEAKLKLLKEIAQDYYLDWDSSNTEEEFNKKHEDLLNGSRKVYAEATVSEPPIKQKSYGSSPSNGTHLTMPNNTLKSNRENEPPINICKAGQVSSAKRVTRSESSEILELARIAIASAERASAAARAASELVNVPLGSWKFEDGKTVPKCQNGLNC